MLARWREGYDVVYGMRRVRRRESLFKRATAAAFYRLLRAMVGVPIPVDTGDFRLMGRRVVLSLRAPREASRLVRGMVAGIPAAAVTTNAPADSRAKRTIRFARC
jgi:dolichol-phosphate mannosyltransferase